MMDLTKSETSKNFAILNNSRISSLKKNKLLYHFTILCIVWANGANLFCEKVWGVTT